ncbi:shikimate kinase [Spirochaeta africana]|uniref:Shikimate kinase n=1 Tax=Spirochaeta africana (strain ATCC 700263 / DSM 8902 / Z-7692) TaxID=889378 RepID=H9UG10_SPIAZ|nr:shikimate kinase [Spirochaeta africana]AFG36453.1 shikimate kinase [Spirochaeta africana DSM 8902]
MSNLVLIGMPGAGKSTVGVLAAKVLGMDFVDTDVIIQQAAGRLLPEIIQEEGIDEFLDIEGEILGSLDLTDTVVSTGGSAVMRPAAVSSLGKGGLVVYLSVPTDEIERRVTNLADRGIAMGPGQNLQGVFAEREPRYREAADVIIDCSGRDIEAVVHAVAEAWHAS